MKLLLYCEQLVSKYFVNLAGQGKKIPKFHTANNSTVSRASGKPISHNKTGKKANINPYKIPTPKRSIISNLFCSHHQRKSRRGDRKCMFIVEENFKQKNLPYQEKTNFKA